MADPEKPKGSCRDKCVAAGVEALQKCKRYFLVIDNGERLTTYSHSFTAAESLIVSVREVVRDEMERSLAEGVEGDNEGGDDAPTEMFR